MTRKRYTLADANKWCGNGKHEPLAMVRMYDRDAVGEWHDKIFIFCSDKIKAAGKIEEVKIAMSIRWPKLEVQYDEGLKSRVRL